MNSFQQHLAAVLLLAILCYIAFFYRLGDYPLWDPDEGRSGVIAKEMVASGNWLTLTHNGEPYYDKPALYFWLVALGSSWFGMNELVVRLPSALAASLIVGLLYLWGCRFGGWQKGVWAAASLGASLEFAALGRFGKMDMVFTLFFTAALLQFFYWKENNEGRGRIWPFYLFLALAALTKGPVGILLPLLVVGVSTGVDKNWVLLKRMRLFRGVGILVLVCGSWYVPAAVRDWEYIKTFLWDHNVLRFLTVKEGLDHAEPFYYFIPVLLVGFLPWSFLLPPVLHRLWEHRGEKTNAERLYLAVWVFTVLIFFSLSRNKLGTYMLPALPPLALLTGDILRDFVAGRETRPWRSRWIFAGGIAWLLLLLLSFPVSELFLKERRPLYFTAETSIVIAFLLLLSGCWVWYRRKRQWMPCIVCVSFLLFALWFYGDKVNAISEVRSSRSLARIVNSNLANNTRVIFIRSESFPFYLSIHAEEVPTPEMVRQKLQEPVRTIALIKEKHIKQFNGRSSNLFVWEAIPAGRALITNFPQPTAQELGTTLNR